MLLICWEQKEQNTGKLRTPEGSYRAGIHPRDVKPTLIHTPTAPPESTSTYCRRWLVSSEGEKQGGVHDHKLTGPLKVEGLASHARSSSECELSGPFHRAGSGHSAETPVFSKLALAGPRAVMTHP